LTPNDKFILKGIYTSLIDDLRDAWYEVTVLRPRFDKIETDPRFIRLAPPMEWVALVTLEARMDDVEGMLNFCIPYPVIEPVLEKLTIK
jgi:flagellar motor switch protein FliM